jgi:hypothetical protein
MTKIAYNACYGGFGLSSAAIKRGREISGNPKWGGWGRDISRADPTLIAVIEELGEAANGDCASLKIRELPVGTKYRIDEYDGTEKVVTIDEYDWETA